MKTHHKPNQLPVFLLFIVSLQACTGGNKEGSSSAPAYTVGSLRLLETVFDFDFDGSPDQRTVESYDSFGFVLYSDEVGLFDNEVVSRRSY